MLYAQLSDFLVKKKLKKGFLAKEMSFDRRKGYNRLNSYFEGSDGRKSSKVGKWVKWLEKQETEESEI